MYTSKLKIKTSLVNAQKGVSADGRISQTLYLCIVVYFVLCVRFSNK